MEEEVQLGLSAGLSMASTAVFFLSGSKRGHILYRLGRAAIRSTGSLLAAMFALLFTLGALSAFFPALDHARDPLVEIFAVVCVGGFWSLLLWGCLKLIGSVAGAWAPPQDEPDVARPKL
jgi:hypothetical protein